MFEQVKCGCLCGLSALSHIRAIDIKQGNATVLQVHQTLDKCLYMFIDYKIYHNCVVFFVQAHQVK